MSTLVKPLKSAGVVVILMVLMTSQVFASSRVPTFGTPDQQDLVRGARSLQDGFEKDAFDKFRKAARLGNKEAQKNLALMYIQGIGVDKDWAKADAWMRLASSLGQPEFVKARKEIAASLRGDEKAAADMHYEELVEEYGDIVALERRERWVRFQKREVTGSRTGKVGLLRVQATDANGKQWELSGPQFYQALDAYILELSEHVGDVRLGELELLDDGNAQ